MAHGGDTELWVVKMAVIHFGTRWDLRKENQRGKQVTRWLFEAGARERYLSRCETNALGLTTVGLAQFLIFRVLSNVLKIWPASGVGIGLGL